MRKKRTTCITFAGAMIMAAVSVFGVNTKTAKADNPIIQNIFAPDPAPMVYNDTVYLYTTHDEDETVNNFYTMLNWHAFSTKDMVNWTSHGQIFSLDDISWANDRAWAAQCIEKDGKFYLYVPVKAEKSGICIGVGVSDSPTGPFVDAIGGPLVDEGDWNDIDPTVFIDDDGQAYLYFGNPELRYVKLNDDMVSYSGKVEKIPMTVESFGPGRSADSASYAEGPWFYKRNNMYYMVYPAFSGTGGENISYSTSDSPTGPWKFGGKILEPNNCYTIHPGVIDYHERSFLFYHGNSLDKGSSYHRSTALEEIFYGDDGSIPSIEQTSEGVKPVRSLNPYERVEGETMAWERGIEVERRADNSCSLTSIHNNNYVKIKEVDFGSTGPVGISVNAACADESHEGTIEFRIGCDEDVNSEASDEKDIFAEGFDLHNTDVDSGEVIATVDVKSTGGEDIYKDIKGVINKKITGVHDVFVVFKGNGDNELFKFDYYQFEQEKPAPAETKPSETPKPSAPAASPTPAPSVSPAPSATQQVPAEVTAPGKTKVTSARGARKSMLIKWKKVNGAKGYQVAYSASKKFKKGVKLVNTKKLKLKIKKLKSKKTYYVKVKAYSVDKAGKKVFGPQSRVVKVKIK